MLNSWDNELISRKKVSASCLIAYFTLFFFQPNVEFGLFKKSKVISTQSRPTCIKCSPWNASEIYICLPDELSVVLERTGLRDSSLRFEIRIWHSSLRFEFEIRVRHSNSRFKFQIRDQIFQIRSITKSNLVNGPT